MAEDNINWLDDYNSGQFLLGICVANWPATGFTRNGVKQGLEEKNLQKHDDLIDGACEP